MIYELRTYVCTPGNRAAFVKRLGAVTLPLFKKYKFRHGPVLLVEIGDNANQEVKYLLEWSSFEDRQTAWNSFFADPDWKRDFAESEKSGSLVTKLKTELLTAAPFSVQ